MKTKKKDKDTPVTKSLREDYISWVIAYSNEYAKLHHLKRQAENGEVISPERVKLITRRLAYAQEMLLETKAALGITDRLAFLENNAFAGFEIRNGQLIGDPALAYQICMPWYYAYVSGSSDNSYKFEVSNLILSLINKE